LSQGVQKMTPECVRGYVILTITSVGHWFLKSVPHFAVGFHVGVTLLQIKENSSVILYKINTRSITLRLLNHYA